MTSPGRATLAISVAFACGLALVAGCGLLGPDPNGPGSFAAVSKAAKSAEETLASQGAKLEQKTYPLGTGWVVDLHDKDVNEETFAALKKLGYIAELNLNGTKIADDHTKHFSGEGIGSVLVELDLGKTEVTDEGLKNIKDSLYLTKLNLSGTKATAAGVAQWEQARASDSRIRPEFKKVKITL
ncbi:MAG: hypothetical protein SH850_22035 [Planctomycetaceae bacterium]|nr:hypothetical protein [Planctomycetaceae bacterium]